MKDPYDSKLVSVKSESRWNIMFEVSSYVYNLHVRQIGFCSSTVKTAIFAVKLFTNRWC